MAELARNISEAETAGAGKDLAATGRRPQSPGLSPERGGEGDKARAVVGVSALGEAEWEWVEPNPLTKELAH